MVIESIYETDSLIFIKFIEKCKSPQSLSSGMKDKLCVPISLISFINKMWFEVTYNLSFSDWKRTFQNTYRSQCQNSSNFERSKRKKTNEIK